MWPFTTKPPDPYGEYFSHADHPTVYDFVGCLASEVPGESAEQRVPKLLKAIELLQENPIYIRTEDTAWGDLGIA